MQFDQTYRKDRHLKPGQGYGRSSRLIWYSLRAGAPTSIVVHATHGRPGTSATNEATFLRNSIEVSAHYLIGRNGIVYEILPPECQAWHAGEVIDPAFGNPHSIGIELHAATSEPILDLQKAQLLALLKRLRILYSIPLDRIKTHRQVAPGRKSDPATWSDNDFDRWLRANLTTAEEANNPAFPILGRPSGQAIHAMEWLKRRSRIYSPYDIQSIVKDYQEIGHQAGIDWFVAIAQMAHETGSLTSWWCDRPRRNPAGIGVTGHTITSEQYAQNPLRYPLDRWAFNWAFNGQGCYAEGVSFPTWKGHAIPAHLGRLLAYALPEGQGTPEQRQLIDLALGVRGLPAELRGCARGWADLDGRWAVPGTTYGESILALADRMRKQ